MAITNEALATATCFGDGAIHVDGSPMSSVTIQEIAHTAYFQAAHLPAGVEPAREETAHFEGPPATFSNATHAVVLEVDPATGHSVSQVRRRLIPSSLDIPKLEISFIETPSPHTALGIKGVGESGTVFAPAAIATAVGDALGVEVNHLGLAPSEVVELMQASVNASGG